MLKYNGYIGSVEMDDLTLHGKILNITDLVTYEAETAAGLQQEFRNAVDDYIETRKEMDQWKNGTGIHVTTASIKD